MFRSNTHARPLGRWIMTSALIGIAGCGGGDEAAAPDPAATAEAPKAGPPTVKGLGSQAKERQGEVDSQAAGGAAPATPADPNAANRQAMMQAQGAGAPGAAATPADPNAANRQAMMQAQGATSGGRKGTEEREGPPPTGPGADAASAASGGGGYVPGYAQSGSQGSGGPGGPGGGPPPGVSFGAAPGPGGQAAAMMPPGGYGAPGTGAPGGGYAGGGGGGGAVLLAETAFLENGEALEAPTGSGSQPGFGGQGGPGGDQAKNDFSEPSKAVESFLSAVTARDGEAIGAAISRRAAGEAKAAGLKKIFTAAVERKLSDEDIANIAETFSDYKVLNMTPGKTSGSVNITIGREKKGTGKTERTTFERRIMRVHRDGNTGWKILDFGNRIVND